MHAAHLLSKLRGAGHLPCTASAPAPQRRQGDRAVLDSSRRACRLAAPATAAAAIAVRFASPPSAGVAWPRRRRGRGRSALRGRHRSGVAAARTRRELGLARERLRPAETVAHVEEAAEPGPRRTLSVGRRNGTSPPIAPSLPTSRGALVALHTAMPCMPGSGPSLISFSRPAPRARAPGAARAGTGCRCQRCP
jgi:hypothetical protein